MNISIIIPVSNDLRIKKCIDSIKNEKIELVISLNKPSKSIKALLKKIILSQKKGKGYKNIKFVICEIKKASIAEAYNNGINNSSFDNIFLMDSDCVFDKECIRRIKRNMGKNLLSKGRVVFLRNSFITNIVAKAREFHTSDEINAYSPPLLFNKKIINFIGGYYFHPSLCWLEDSEFDKRIRTAGLKIAYDPEAVVYHPPLSPLSDLRSSFWYGVGKRIGVELGIHDKPTNLAGSIRKYLFIASKKKGVSVGIYLFIWKTSLLTGYSSQALFRLRK